MSTNNFRTIFSNQISVGSEYSVSIGNQIFFSYIFFQLEYGWWDLFGIESKTQEKTENRTQKTEVSKGKIDYVV